MPVFRLSPLTRRPLRATQGDCAACGKPIAGSDGSVRIYGELLHQNCAYYRPRRTRGNNAA